MQGFSVFHLPQASAKGQTGKPFLLSSVSSLAMSFWLWHRTTIVSYPDAEQVQMWP